MTIFRNQLFFLVSTFLFIACNIPGKGKKETDSAVAVPAADSFSIRTIVKDFQNDTSIREVKGVQTELYLTYIEYCVYVAKKNRVLKGVNKIVSKNKEDFSSDAECYPVSKAGFYSSTVTEEKRKELDFFWKFERLKSYKIYECIKAPLRHYIIFDDHSDTVYHRIEELRD